jgi:hypothetical protein
MARKESDLVASDNWQVNGLIADGHPMSGWAQRRIKGVLAAEATEAVRRKVADMQGFDITTTEGRKSVKDYMDNEANTGTVAAIRAEVVNAAKAEFASGEYGKGRVAGERKPTGDPLRVQAIMPFIVELLAAKGKAFDPQSVSRNERVNMVSEFESKYARKHGARIAELTAHLPKVQSKTAELFADL